MASTNVYRCSQVPVQISEEQAAESDDVSKSDVLNRRSLDSVDLQETGQMGMRIVFHELTYLVKNRANSNEKLALLKQISGYYLPGEMAAVMGPSGSGNTSSLSRTPPLGKDPLKFLLGHARAAHDH